MSRLTCARHHLLPHEENFTPHFTGPCLMCVPQTFSAAQAIAPNDESLAMNIKATIVDWHKFIMTQEIVATAAAEARRTGVQWTFNASEGEAVKRSRSPVTSPFWDIPNLLRGRNYTERAEVIFKEIVESRELNLLPAAIAVSVATSALKAP